MLYEITVMTAQRKRHVEEVDSATFTTPIPLATLPAAITPTTTLSNPITLPSGVVGDVLYVKHLWSHLTHLADDEPTWRIYP